MDKYEYKLRADEIKELIARGEYAQAAEIADTIDWRRVKSVLMLCTISDLYKINRRYADARNMLLLAYERRPGGRTICYSLCELSIKMEEYVQAVEYYKEFVQVAPKDSGRYILQYKLYEAQNVSLEERIEVLEELKKRDYREKWVYELAYLYHRMGLGTRCVEVCDEMIVWFGEGKYVIKAMELKMLHQPLTPQQQEKYDNRFNPQPAKTEMVTTDSDTVPEESVEEGADIVSDAEVTDNAIAVPDESDTSVVNEEVSQETKIFEPVRVSDDGRVIAPDEEFDIQVKTVDVGQYNTMNLQAELAEQLREVLGEESTQDAITRSILAPMLESDTESLDMPEIDEVDEEDLEDEIAELEESEVFFGETGEIKDISIPGMVELTASEQPVDDQDSRKEDEEFDRGGEQQPESSAIISTETGEAPAKTFTNIEPPKAMAGVLSQEADGQLSLVMPDVESVEKQITGQMSIEDILAEWERLKKENEEKRREDVRQRVLEQTGSMFTEFEASLRDDILKEPMLAGDPDEVVKAALEAQESYGEQGAEGQSLQEEIQSEESAEEDIYGEAYAQGAIDEDPEGGESLDEEIITEEASAGIAWEAASEEVIAEEIIDGEMTEDAVSDEGVTEEEIDGESEDLGEVEELEEILEGEEFDGIEFDAVDETADTEEEPVVERDKAKTRNLTKEERELFAAYAQNKKARDQLVNMIDNVSLAAYTGNVIVTGDEGIDTMTLAKNLIREVQLTDSNFSGKVAKISGNALNNKNVVTVLSDLNNGALIISKASEINQQTATVLNRALQQENQGIIIVFEDKKKDMDRFLKKYPELSECFTSRMDIEAMTNEALTNFGKQYAREREYFIDDMGALALQTRIELIQTSDHVATVMDVKEIVDEAIRNANRKSVGHFIDILTSKRYDDEDMIVLREKDFI